MKLLYTLTQKNKAKIVIILLSSIVSLVCIEYWQTNKIKKIQTNFTSIYSDRLVPATELLFISNRLHSKRMLLEGYLWNGDTATHKLNHAIQQSNLIIDSLVLEYEKTYFVTDEKKSLAFFKHNLLKHKQVEKLLISQLVNDNLKEAKSAYNESKKQFDLLIDNLSYLVTLQTIVGENLISDSNMHFAGTHIMLNLRIVLIIILGLFILIIIRSNNLTINSNQRFNLN